MGLREQKKEQTRLLIAQAALKLFAERGFDRVPVAEVARAANVSEATVFNYFPTKEDLVYRGLEEFEERLLTAVRDRGPRESILAAFGRLMTQTQGLLASKDPQAARMMGTVTQVIMSSEALQARERHMFDRYTNSLAEVIAHETSARPGDIEPWVVANLLVGIHRGLLGYVRRQILAGKRGAAVARQAQAQAEKALSLLEQGLGGYP